MSIVRKVAPLSPAAFLEAERTASARHELVGGQTHEMVGASQVHNLITVTLAARLHGLLAAPWRVYASDAKVRVGDDFYYPDVVVSKEPVAPEVYYLTEPVVIVEVLSPTTEARDRLEKRLAYRRLPSLAECVLVAHDRRAAEIFRRSDEGWELESYVAGESLHLASRSLRLALDDIYACVREAVPGMKTK